MACRSFGNRTVRRYLIGPDTWFFLDIVLFRYSVIRFARRTFVFPPQALRNQYGLHCEALNYFRL